MEGLVAFAGDLVDFVDEDDAALCASHIVVGHLQQTAEDAFHVFADVTVASGRGAHEAAVSYRRLMDRPSTLTSVVISRSEMPVAPAMRVSHPASSSRENTSSRDIIWARWRTSENPESTLRPRSSWVSRCRAAPGSAPRSLRPRGT